MIILVIKEKSDHSKSQRALVFNGGGTLEAYEAGIFKTIYNKLIDKFEDKKIPLFDIVAGTFAGAINAVLLVNYVIQKVTWRGSANILIDFWKDILISGFMINLNLMKNLPFLYLMILE